LSNLGSDDWFVKAELQEQAYAAAVAAAEAYAMQEAGSTHPSSSSSSSRSAASAVSAALLPFIDETRIAALAAVEPDTLWFMSELVSWTAGGMLCLCCLCCSMCVTLCFTWHPSQQVACRQAMTVMRICC
jgi:uncharacterized membrane protein YgcG